MCDLSIIHRDLKLENLLLSQDDVKGDIKIADLGLSRNLTDTAMTATICGTPLYSAPEVLSGDFYNFKADTWSLGAIVYELLIGIPPFNAATIPELRKLQKLGIHYFYNTNLSLDCQDLIKKCLVFNPVERVGIEEILNHPWLIR